MSQPLTRKLAAILYADVAGYSRLTGEDEDGTHRLLSGRLDLVADAIATHGGRVVHYAGDAVLADFPTASDALRCAVDAQTRLAARDTALPEERQLRFRMGVNMGEVIVDRDDIYGDGVNVAARLESLADPGGVCISGTVYDAVGNKLPFGYEFMGEQQVKNIERPVRAYRVLAEGDAPDGAQPASPGRAGRRIALAALALALAAAGALGMWLAGSGDTTTGPRQPPGTPSTAPAELSGADAVTDSGAKKSIAVLPFFNLSGDPEQEYFIDGVTNDLITDLSQLSDLMVIAANSVFTYKGTAVKVQQVAAELGVAYVLEGSVQRAGARVRVNAQLVDASNGHQLWAERFDSEVTDILTLQDEVSRRIVTALAVTLTPSERQRLDSERRVNPDAYDALLRGLELFRRFTRETNAEARRHFERAVAIDPLFARGHADIALSHALDLQFGWLTPGGPAQEHVVDVALTHGEEALRLEPDLREGYFALTVLYTFTKEIDRAVAAGREAIRIDPNYADGYAALAQSLVYAGRPAESLQLMKVANRLNPRASFFYEWIEGHASMLLGDHERAIERFRNVIARNPAFPGAHLTLAATLSQTGHIEDARWEAAELLTLLPDFSLAHERERRQYARTQDMDWYIEGLRKAGLPE